MRTTLATEAHLQCLVNFALHQQNLQECCYSHAIGWHAVPAHAGPQLPRRGRRLRQGFNKRCCWSAGIWQQQRMLARQLPRRGRREREGGQRHKGCACCCLFPNTDRSRRLKAGTGGTLCRVCYAQPSMHARQGMRHSWLPSFTLSYPLLQSQRARWSTHLGCAVQCGEQRGVGHNVWLHPAQLHFPEDLQRGLRVAALRGDGMRRRKMGYGADGIWRS